MTLCEAEEVRHLRVGAVVAQLLFTHKPRTYNLVHEPDPQILAIGTILGE